jgi:nitrogen PTS system EIIA component
MHHTPFNHGSVIIDLENTEKFAAIHEIIVRAEVFKFGLDLEVFERAVRERELIQSTGVGHGVAFAHGKLSEATAMKVALGISRKGIAYDSIDGKPVHLLFVVATNPNHQIDYLKCLSRLACLLRRESFREELLNCFCGEDIRNKLHTEYSRLQNLAAVS